MSFISLQVQHKNIVELEADVMVNASNGIGFMGGILGRYIRFDGVAESINFQTKGSVEKEAKSIAIPLLGTCTGRLNKKDVLNLYNSFFKNINIENIDIIIFYKLYL